MAAPWLDWTKEASRLETLWASAAIGKSNPQIRIRAKRKMAGRRILQRSLPWEGFGIRERETWTTTAATGEANATECWRGGRGNVVLRAADVHLAEVAPHPGAILGNRAPG